MSSEGAERRPRRAVPHIREFLADSLTPLSVYRRLAKISPHRFLFESVSGGERVSRFSFLGAGPREIYRLYEDRLEVEKEGKKRRLPGEPLDAQLEQLRHSGQSAQRERNRGLQREEYLNGTGTGPLTGRPW